MSRLIVTELESYGRNASGTVLGGMCTFSDGKCWRWHRSPNDGDFYFVIDTGVPCQWSTMNYGRTVTYPKRVSALLEKLIELGEISPDEKNAALCLENGRVAA